MEKIQWKSFEIIEIFIDKNNEERCEHCWKKIKNVCIIKNDLGQVFHTWKTCFQKIIDENKVNKDDKKNLEWITKKNFNLLKEIKKAKGIFYNEQYFILFYWKKDWIAKSYTYEFDDYKEINFEKLIEKDNKQEKWHFSNSKDSILELLKFMNLLV